jgi:hypothetical protein
MKATKTLDWLDRRFSLIGSLKNANGTFFKDPFNLRLYNTIIVIMEMVIGFANTY